MVDNTLRTCEATQPWVVYTYLTTDEEADRTGRTQIDMRCAICGRHEIAAFPIYGPNEAPPPETNMPGYRHPLRKAFLAKHMHPDERHAHPITWALPLLNPGAHSQTMDVLETVANKAREEAKRDDRA